MMLVGFIHVAACGSIFIYYCDTAFHYRICHYLLNHCPQDKHLCCFQFSAIKNYTAIIFLHVFGFSSPIIHFFLIYTQGTEFFHGYAHMLNFCRSYQAAVVIYSLSRVSEHYSCSVVSPTLGNVNLFHCSHSGGYNFHFSNDSPVFFSFSHD